MRVLCLCLTALIVLTSCAASNDTAFDTALKQQHPELDTVETVVTEDVDESTGNCDWRALLTCSVAANPCDPNHCTSCCYRNLSPKG